MPGRTTGRRQPPLAPPPLVVLGAQPAARAGEVWLVGAGPGDPELLTLKALKALQRADVVVHDGLVSEAVLALSPARARRLSVAKRASRHSYAQDEINRLLVAFARGDEPSDALAAEAHASHRREAWS